MKNRNIPAIVFTGGLSALYFAAPFLPPGLTWGFHSLGFLGPLTPAVFLLVGLGLVYAVRSEGAGGWISRVAGVAGSRGYIVPAASLCLFAAAGFIFRVRVPLLGDGWFLVRNFAGAIQGTDTLLPRDEPLATYYFSTVIGLFGVKTYPGFLDAFFAGDMILGAGFILIAWATVRVLFTGAVERLVSFAIVCSLPAMNLFFGYVETYSVVLFTLALYAWTGSLFLRRRAPFVLAALAFLLQVLTHYLTILTLPSLLYLGYIGWRRGDAKQIIAGAAAFGLSALLVLAVVEFSVENYFSRVPHRHYLPVVQPDDINERYSSPYTMFSPYHAVDLGNLAVLLAAAAAFLFVSAPSAGPRGDTGSSEAHAGTGRFLLSASLPVVLFTLVAKFDLGMARDWDVIAPYSYLLTLSALGRYFRRARPGDDARPVVLAGGMSLACSLLWFSVNASPAASVERFLSLLDPRMIGQGGMYNGNLYLSRYYRQAGIGEERSAALWERYLGLYPGDMRAYRNIIVNMQAAPPDAVIEKMSGWRRRFGDNPVTRGAVVTLSLEAGNSALGKNRPGEAGIFYAAALAADSGSAAAWNNLGIVRARAGDFGDASRMFTRAVEIDSTFADAWFNLGRAWVALGDDESGRRAFTLSARFGNEAAKKLLSGDSAGR